MYRDENKVIEDSFQAFLTEIAKFTEVEEYPILEEQMISQIVPKKIIPFDKCLTYKGKDKKDVFVCTYSRDQTFERIKRNPKRYINCLKEFGGIIGFDFSVHSDFPIIKQKYTMDLNLSLTYFYGSLGIPIIPNIRCGVDILEEEYFKCFPKNTLVAIGTHGFIKTISDQAEWYVLIEKIIKILNPSGIIVYGNLNGKIFYKLKGKINFYFFKPWISEDFERRKKNGV